MSIETVYICTEKFLSVNTSGNWITHKFIIKIIEDIAYSAKKLAYRKVLINAYELSAPPSDIYRYVAGENLAKHFGSEIKVAILYKEELLNNLTENTARNRGANVLITSNETEAINWLNL